uniref:Uncharacterized protein n=1 Tax=Chelonoidis abingdonii TaxID=106734 RepID=A0A8C0J6V5_CHEAB
MLMAKPGTEFKSLESLSAALSTIVSRHHEDDLVPISPQVPALSFPTILAACYLSLSLSCLIGGLRCSKRRK